MNSTLTYTAVDVSAIAKALATLFDTGADEQVLTRASATNVIVTGVSLTQLLEATKMVEMIAPLHPARFFIPVMDPAAHGMRAEVAAACVRVSNGNDVCSEVVRIFFPQNVRSAVPSVIRANMLPGLPSEAFAFGWDDSSLQLIKQSDQVYLDSHTLSAGELLSLLDTVIQYRVPTIDFNWVRLGMWREEVKRIFDLGAVNKSVHALSLISIESYGYTFGEYDASAFTLAGWFVRRLNAEPVAFSANGWECRKRGGDSFTLTISKSTTTTPCQGISKVALFSGSSGGDNMPLASVQRTSLLESYITVDDTKVVLKRAVEKDDPIEVVERFFLVGDSTTNYEGSLKTGLEMFRLTRGFTG